MDKFDLPNSPDTLRNVAASMSMAGQHQWIDVLMAMADDWAEDIEQVRLLSRSLQNVKAEPQIRAKVVYGPDALKNLADGFEYARCPELANALKELAYLWDNDLKTLSQ